MSQSFVVACLATSGWTNDHKTMSNSSGIIKLNDLIDKRFLWLQVELFTTCNKLIQ
jgi:hypothetical protein